MPAPRPYRRSLLRQERSLNTRRMILRAATQVWATRDFDSTTIEELCAAAGIGRSTFYLYFESKERVLVALASETARGVADDVDTWTDAGTVEEAMAVFVDGLVRRMERVPRTLAALVMRQVAVANVSPRPVADDPILFHDIFTGIVRDGQRRGEVRGDLDAREVGEALAGMTLDALERWASGDPQRTLREIIEFRISLILDAIRTDTK
jgi:AcrR family transcriptional regulator